MKRQLGIAAFAVLAAVCCTPALAQEVPFTGEVIQDGVQARCGAGNRYYVVGTLPKGTKVRVDEIFYGWNKIVPPEGVYSYISQAFVDAKGDGKTGEVTADGQDVKAASLQSPGESWRVQTTLNKGAIVQIVGKEGSFYKIVPPKDAYVFLPPGSVQRVEGAAPKPEPLKPAPKPEEPAKPEPKPEPAKPEPKPEPVVEEPVETPAEPVAETPAEESVETPAEMTAEEPVVEAPAQEPIPMEKGGAPLNTAITTASFAEVEKAMYPNFLKPVLEQPLDEMLSAYESVDPAELTASEKQLLALRLRAVRDNKKLADTLHNIDRVQKEVDEGIVAQEIESQKRKVLDLSDYDVTGTLSVSAVYSGETLPRLYRIVNGEGRNLAWVLPRAPVDAKQHIGKLVGILGKKQYDDALKQHVYVVDRIDLLTPGGSQAAPQTEPAEQVEFIEPADESTDTAETDEPAETASE